MEIVLSKIYKKDDLVDFRMKVNELIDEVEKDLELNEAKLETVAIVTNDNEEWKASIVYCINPYGERDANKKS